ncbi:MAG: ribosome biogenesis GTP-binding protein YihA/YsxC [Alicyclobacillus sp.]|nr:ribosome biogenesis GTP-binding protein YihA/YsxC [Alicyclobacillus sp.]
MIVKEAVFEISAVRPAQWPPDGLPEFAFIGRSNVGKSSLLNRLLNRKSLARVSATPGKTQQINFYRINNAFRFADLPGYGYAAVSKTQRAQFAGMIETYFQKRTGIQRVFHLVDIRHEPTDLDVRMHQWLLACGLSPCVIATKQDKVSKSAVPQALKRIRLKLATSCPVLPVSAEQRLGLDAVWSEIERDLSALAPDLSGANAGPSDIRISEEHANQNE